MTIKQIKQSACAERNKELLSVQPEKRNKFFNQPVEFDGKTFDSIKERDRYITLRMLLVSGLIENLECQVEFILETEDKKVCSYFADFTYRVVKSRELRVEDVKSKGTKTAVYKLKKKLMMALYGIEIKEV